MLTFHEALTFIIKAFAITFIIRVLLEMLCYNSNRKMNRIKLKHIPIVFYHLEYKKLYKESFKRSDQADFNQYFIKAIKKSINKEL